MTPWHEVIAVGDATTTRRTVSEGDIYLFGGITGDLHQNHFDDAYMREGSFGQRIAHGALIVGLMSGASTRFSETRREHVDSVSLGYDRIRFLAPVHCGDTIQIDYRIDAIDLEQHRSTAAVIATNQHGATVAVAQHITKYIR